MAKTIGLVLLYVAAACLFSSVESHRQKGLLGFFGFGSNNGGKEYYSGQKEIEKNIQQNITDAINDKIPTETLVQVLTAMNSSDAQKSLKQLNINPTTLVTLRRKLTGTAQEVAEARQTIKTQAAAVRLDQLKKKDWKAIQQLLGVYQNYLYKQSAKKSINEDSTDKLIQGLNALSIVERIFWFRGILFQDLAQSLQKNGEQGRKEVVEKLSKWIDTADIQSVKKAALVYSLATTSKSGSSTTVPPSVQPTSPGFVTLSTQRPSTNSSLSPSVGASTPSGGQSTLPPSTTPQRRPE